MKKLVVALMLVSMSLVSCGKNNSTNSGATSSTVNPITNTAVSGATELGAIVDNYTTYFGSAIAYNYISYGQMANQGVNLKYRYTKSTASNTNNCSLKWGIFYVCSYATSSSTSTNLTESRSVLNNEVNVVKKQNELKSYINNSYAITRSTATAYLLYLKDGRKVIIDTAIPLQGQPSAIQETNGTSEYLFQITQ